MKTLVAIFKPFRLDAVRKALEPVGARNVSFTDVRGYGRQKGNLDAYDGSDLAIEFIPKIRLEMEVEDLFVPEAVKRVCEAARTGRIGDGKIFVFTQNEPSAPGEDRPDFDDEPSRAV